MDKSKRHEHDWVNNQILVASKLHELGFCKVCRIWRETITDLGSRKQISELLLLRGYGRKKC